MPRFRPRQVSLYYEYTMNTIRISFLWIKIGTHRAVPSDTPKNAQPRPNLVLFKSFILIQLSTARCFKENIYTRGLNQSGTLGCEAFLGQVASPWIKHNQLSHVHVRGLTGIAVRSTWNCLKSVRMQPSYASLFQAPSCLAFVYMRPFPLKVTQTGKYCFCLEKE
jgi:hypothetical protein